MHEYYHIRLVSRRAWQGVGEKSAAGPTSSADNAVHARRETSPKGAPDAPARRVPPQLCLRQRASRASASEALNEAILMHLLARLIHHPSYCDADSLSLRRDGE